MLSAIWTGRSLRGWIAIGMALAVLPLGISAVAGYLLLNHGVIASFQDVAARQRNQIDPAQHLRLLMWDAIAPVDDFVDEGDPRQPQAYRSIRQQIEAAFATLHDHVHSDPELEALVERARDDWTAGDRLAAEVISVRRPPGDPHSAELMDGFHGLIASSVDKLGAVYSTLATDIHADHDEAILYFERSEWVAGIAAAVSLLAIVAGVVTIGRIMAASVDQLVDGAERFAAGDRTHRIEIRVPPELHKVAEEFNRMIRRIHESEDALADLARRDGLTRLLNRRAFDEALAEMFARKERFGERFALLMLDLDHFKQVNDTYGHAVGDDVLHAAARAMESNLRATDRAFRIGGEEFTVILPGNDVAAARMTAERIREAVSTTPCTINGASIGVTVSVGVVSADDASTAGELVKAADAALYRAKTGGRNQVVANGETPVKAERA